MATSNSSNGSGANRGGNGSGGVMKRAMDWYGFYKSEFSFWERIPIPDQYFETKSHSQRLIGSLLAVCLMSSLIYALLQRPRLF
jgi:hypothetical protein